MTHDEYALFIDLGWMRTQFPQIPPISPEYHTAPLVDFRQKALLVENSQYPSCLMELGVRWEEGGCRFCFPKFLAKNQAFGEFIGEVCF